MEAAAQRDGRRDDGQGNKDANAIPSTWYFHSWLRETCVNLAPVRLEKR
jgi:hypothetical protein